jgi:hypothetical protein
MCIPFFLGGESAGRLTSNQPQSRSFTAAFEQSPDLAPTLTQIHIAGHNHISPPLGLGLGGKEEQWGEEVVTWCREQ